MRIYCTLIVLLGLASADPASAQLSTPAEITAFLDRVAADSPHVDASRLPAVPAAPLPAVEAAAETERTAFWEVGVDPGRFPIGWENVEPWTLPSDVPLRRVPGAELTPERPVVGKNGVRRKLGESSFTQLSGRNRLHGIDRPSELGRFVDRTRGFPNLNDVKNASQALMLSIGTRF